jgi:hypothetical protein
VDRSPQYINKSVGKSLAENQQLMALPLWSFFFLWLHRPDTSGVTTFPKFFGDGFWYTPVEWLFYK